MEVKEVFEVGRKVGSLSDGVISWSAHNLRRRFMFITIVGIAFGLMTWGSFSYLLHKSEEEGKARLSLYLHSLERQRFEKAIDAVEQCIQSRKEASGDSGINCGLAEVLYSNLRQRLVGDRYQQVMEKKAYSAMLIDFQDMLRFHEGRAVLDRPAGPHSEALSFLLSPVGLACGLGLILLAYGVAAVRMLQWQFRHEAVLPRQNAQAERDEDMVVGDMPNLPHERIHHPDRR